MGVTDECNHINGDLITQEFKTDLHTNTHRSENMKVRTNVLIEKELLAKAHELGINVSKACENALKVYINALTNANSAIALGKNRLPNDKTFNSRWPSRLGHRLGKAVVAGSNPARGSKEPKFEETFV